MAQSKTTEKPHGLASEDLNQPPRSPSKTSANTSKLKLIGAVGPYNFFSETKTVTQVLIPKKPDFDDEQFEEVFFSQLRDGRLICSYPDGTIALLNNNHPTKPLEYLPILPASKTRAIHELSDGYVVVCLLNEEAHENYLVKLVDRTQTKLNLPPVKVCSVLSNDEQSVYFGLQDGRLISWNFKEDTLIQSWHMSTTEDNEFEHSDTSPDIQSLDEINNTQENGLPILCIAKNEDQQLFIVLDVADGYLACLFNQAELTLSRSSFLQHQSFEKLSKEISTVFFSESGKLTLIFNTTNLRNNLEILSSNKEGGPEETVNSEKDIFGQSGFCFPNGFLAFSGYNPKYNASQDRDKPPVTENILEIH